MKPADVHLSMYIDYGVENNETAPRIKFCGHVRKSNCPQNRSKEVFEIEKVKNTVNWTYVISDRNGKNCW